MEKKQDIVSLIVSIVNTRTTKLGLNPRGLAKLIYGKQDLKTKEFRAIQANVYNLTKGDAFSPKTLEHVCQQLGIVGFQPIYKEDTVSL